MIVDPEKYQIKRWWETLENRVDIPSKFNDRVEQFRELIEDAVRIRCRNDVDTGITLSGGMDSSAVYALSKTLQSHQQIISATEKRTKEIKVFSVSYPGQAIDESPYVEQCLNVYGDKAQYIYPKPDQFSQLLNEVIWHQESFVWNASVFAFHLIYKQIADTGIRVILEGHGSDEMLAGYPYFVQLAMKTFQQQNNWWGVWQSAKCLTQTMNTDLEQYSQPSWRLFMQQIPLWQQGGYLWRKIRPRSINLLSVEGMNRNHYLLPELLQKPEYNFLIEAEQSLDPFRWSLYDAFHRRILPNVLRVFDRATMAASLESRMPFMDYRIVQYVFSLPISDIVNNGETKHILRQAVKNILPDTIINRKAKMGFAVSLKQWFNDPKVYNYLSEIVHDSSFYDHNFINKNKFILEFDRALEQGFSWQDTIRVWEVVNLSLWWQIFVKKNVNY